MILSTALAHLLHLRIWAI